jgi:zinc transporter ZupT
MFYVPNDYTTGVMMGFGNGSLLCALAVEMFASCASDFTAFSEKGHMKLAIIGLCCMIVGTLCGSVAFIMLNRRLGSLTSKPHHTPIPSENVQELKPLEKTVSIPTEVTILVENDSESASDSEDIESPYPVGQPLIISGIRRFGAALSNSMPEQSQADAQAHRSVMSLWLGLMLDGIPEAMVIGFMVRESRLSYGFIVGVFIANFPEALSGACIQRKCRLSTPYIFSLWTSLLVMTSVVSCVTAQALHGSLCVSDIDFGYVLMELCEGMAGGAMLTMLACVAIPESYRLAGDQTGLATVVGFLVTILVVVLSGHASDEGDLRC